MGGKLSGGEDMTKGFSLIACSLLGGNLKNTGYKGRGEDKGGVCMSPPQRDA